MDHYIITGTSSGIGQALAEAALEAGHRVTGISRRQTLEHAHYQHLALDLSRPENYRDLKFEFHPEARHLALVNNAGWIGEARPLGRIDPGSIEKAFQLNLIAPAILSQMFLAQSQSHPARKTLLNISSGAGQYPVPGWSTYCASKAGIDLLTQVAAKDHSAVRCLAVAPGIVDTAMQDEIRSAAAKDFPEVERFIRYKKEGDLRPAGVVGAELLQLLEDPEKTSDIVVSLSDL